jgi:predicted ABC-type ATPase
MSKKHIEDGGQGDLGVASNPGVGVVDPSSEIELDFIKKTFNKMKQQIEESKELTIKDLQDLLKNEKIYVLMAGSVGSGKSFFTNKYFKEIKTLDPDDIKKSLGYNDENKKVTKSIKILQKEVEELFKKGISFIQQGTSANLQSTINKLIKARKYDYKTVLIYIDGGSDEEILAKIKKRVDNGGHGKSIDLYKIQKTKKFSKLTLKVLSNQLVDIDDMENSNINKSIEKTIKDIKKAQDLLDFFLIID